MSKPEGMEHQTRDYAAVKMQHFIINLHQEAFPELAEKMKFNPDATKFYTAFLAMIPLQIKGVLTPEIRKEILEAYKL